MTNITEFRIWITYKRTLEDTIPKYHNLIQEFVTSSSYAYWPLSGDWYA